MNYWLFKTEPDEFSIDDLERGEDQTTRWDGIRNYQARNLLRDEVAVGDQVFIYHSSCANIGVVGIATISKAAYPDPAQFNPSSQYYDAKASQDDPPWFCVEVKFKERFPRLVSLAEIKDRPELADMVLVNNSRLSIQPVTAEQWQVIERLAKS